ncbi:MAG: hypothetical protein H7138_14285 [Myxococcales bacterium]|nr:hypothetical protein [Myxococcales bacterium]
MLRVLRGMVPLLAACSSASDPEPEPAPALRIAERAGHQIGEVILRGFAPPLDDQPRWPM